MKSHEISSGDHGPEQGLQSAQLGPKTYTRSLAKREIATNFSNIVTSNKEGTSRSPKEVASVGPSCNIT